MRRPRWRLDGVAGVTRAVSVPGNNSAGHDTKMGDALRDADDHQLDSPTCRTCAKSRRSRELYGRCWVTNRWCNRSETAFLRRFSLLTRRADPSTSILVCNRFADCLRVKQVKRA